MKKLMMNVIDEIIKTGDYDKARELIHNELCKDIFNEKMYFYLGNIHENIGEYNRAYLCYEHALSIRDNSNYKELINAKKEDMLRTHKVCVNKVSIVILTYNNLEYTKICLDSIRKYSDLSSCEIIVVDNNSTDGTQKWLKEQRDIKIILNEENKGFPKGCNQGIEIAEKENDIFLLNNDTVIMPNSIFNLRMGLYSNEKIGAVGSVSNSVSNYQQISEVYDDFDGYMDYALVNNISDPKRYERRIKLVGFAMLIKRKVLEKTGYLDEIFTPGNYEDDDISFRILNAGYELLVCKDSYIHHFGSVSFAKNIQSYIDLLKTNEEKFDKKWGFSCKYSSHIRYDLLSLINADRDEHINVLEIGCAAGGTLLEIKNRYPNSEVYGIELNENSASIAKNFAEVTAENIELNDLDYNKGFFDYIILGDVLEHLINPEKVLDKLKYYLKDTGVILTSIPNVMHYSVIYNLMGGNWTYEDSGIMDRTHLRFFTKKEILNMFERCNYSVMEMGVVKSEVTAESEKYINELMKLSGVEEKDQYYVVQYINKIMKKELFSKIPDLIKKLELDYDSEEIRKQIINLIKKNILNEKLIIDIVNKESVEKIKVFNLLAILCYENQVIDMILPLLNEAYEIDSNDVDTNYNLAYILSLMGENELAVRFLNNIKIEDDKVINLKKQMSLLNNV